jgi:hypothetical protein
VIDEYGGTDGLVSIEDIVEQIVGDIEDEHDERGKLSIVRQSDGSYLADARASLEDVVAMVGVDFDIGEASEEVDTLGGYLVGQLGRLPVRGELVSGPGPFEIEVLDADPRRVKRLRILRRQQPRLTRVDPSRRDGEPEAPRRIAAAPLARPPAESPASPTGETAATVDTAAAPAPPTEPPIESHPEEAPSAASREPLTDRVAAARVFPLSRRRL